MGGGHKGTHTFLTGIKSSDAKNMPEGNISVDQKAAQFVGTQTRYPSLQLVAVLIRLQECHGPVQVLPYTSNPETTAYL